MNRLFETGRTANAQWQTRSRGADALLELLGGPGVAFQSFYRATGTRAICEILDCFLFSQIGNFHLASDI